MATWREGGKKRNVHLGAAQRWMLRLPLQKVRKMKAAALAIKL